MEKNFEKETSNIKLLNEKITKINNSRLSFIRKFLYSNDCKDYEPYLLRELLELLLFVPKY